MAEASGGQKSEKPTPQRLKKAREQGQFLTARGAISAIQFLVFVFLLGKLVPEWKARIQLCMAALLERSMTHEIGPAEWPGILRDLIINTLIPILTLPGIILVASVAVHLAITGLGFSLQNLTPKFDRFNPISRLKELPSRNLQSLLEAVALILVLGLTIYSFASQNAPALLRLPFESVSAASAEVADSMQSLLWKAAGAFILFGAVDIFRQYRKHSSALKMTKQEIKEESKRNDGDPQIRARIRRLRCELLRRQMMKEVPKASAVIVNPTHFAVAIRYDVETMASPMVVAKGKNWLALRIRQIAIENQVPIIENPPLARALYSAIDVGRPIPPEFYNAIAEILAYIYKLMGRKLRG